MTSIHATTVGKHFTTDPQQRIRETAQDFVQSFFAQSVGLMLKDNNPEHFERDIYSPFLADAIAEKIAASPVAEKMVEQVYAHLSGNQKASKAYQTAQQLSQNPISPMDNGLVTEENTDEKETAHVLL